MENHNFQWVNPLWITIFNSKLLVYQKVNEGFSILLRCWIALRVRTIALLDHIWNMARRWWGPRDSNPTTTQCVHRKKNIKPGQRNDSTFILVIYIYISHHITQYSVDSTIKIIYTYNIYQYFININRNISQFWLKSSPSSTSPFLTFRKPSGAASPWSFAPLPSHSAPRRLASAAGDDDWGDAPCGGERLGGLQTFTQSPKNGSWNGEIMKIIDKN